MSNDDDLIRQVMADNPGAITDFASTAVAVGWLQHLAAPAAWAVVWPRITEPIGELLQSQIAHFIRYARSGKRYSEPDFQPVPYEQRVSRAEHLQSLLATWVPPELTEPIIRAARDVLHAEGLSPSLGWDAIEAPPNPSQAGNDNEEARIKRDPNDPAADRG